MTRTPAYNEEHLASLLTAFPPAPRGWVEAAQELPVAGQRLDEIVARAEADAAFRAALLADLEAALAAEGYERSPFLVDSLRRRLEARS